MKKTIFIAIVIISTSAALLYLHFQNSTEISVKVIAVAKGEISSTLSATGKVISKKEADISASVPAQVKAIYVEEGQRIEKNDPLALLDDREFLEKVKGGEESLREADEKVRQLERNYEGLAAVFAAGGTSRQSVDDAGSGLEMARAAAKRALAELNGIKIVLDKLKIRAPFTGIVTRKNISPGEWAAPGVPIFSMSKENRREIEVMVDESDAGLVKEGQSVELTSDAFPGYRWTELVKEVAPAVRKEGSANSIKVLLSYGTKAPDLKLGQQVDAKIRTEHRADAVKIPFSTLINKDGKTLVAMVTESTIRFVPVITGIEDAISVEIVQGLSEGEEVILPEGKVHQEGERVKTIVREPARP